mmetsp:Transcript_8820/g.26428  ORF Transcript_8820/g.26428 Transcript_8820/m.26428 type:complete len:243 (-) Transcript_8820:293-1021(-)
MALNTTDVPSPTPLPTESLGPSCTMGIGFASENCTACVSDGCEWCEQITGIGWCGPSGTLGCDGNTPPPVTQSSACIATSSEPACTKGAGIASEECTECIPDGCEWCEQITGIGWCGPPGTLGCDWNTPSPVRNVIGCAALIMRNLTNGTSQDGGNTIGNKTYIPPAQDPASPINTTNTTQTPTSSPVSMSSTLQPTPGPSLKETSTDYGSYSGGGRQQLSSSSVSVGLYVCFIFLSTLLRK